MPIPVLGHAASRALHAARAWPERSQQVARRNAMREATACAQRRAEREEIDEYVRAARAPRRTHRKARHTGG
jgi:hypothetical protein